MLTICILRVLRLSPAGNGGCPFTQVRLSSKSHPCRFYSALQGRTQAGWLRWKGGVGGSQLGGEVEGAPLLPWRWAPRLLSLGRGARAACACVWRRTFPRAPGGAGWSPQAKTQSQLQLVGRKRPLPLYSCFTFPQEEDTATPSALPVTLLENQGYKEGALDRDA